MWGPRNIHPNPWEGCWTFWGGALNSQFCLKEANYQNWNLLMQAGGPNKKKTFHGRGMDMFWNNTTQILFTNWYTQILFILAVRLQFTVILLSFVSLTSLASINISGRNIVLTNALDSLCKFGIIYRRS